jgi:hypothetical protein
LLNTKEVYPSFTYNYQVIDSLKDLKDLDSNFRTIKVDPKVLTIKQSWNNNKYYKQVDTNLNIIFNDYITDGKFCVFKFQSILKNTDGRKFYKDEYINLKVGEIDWRVINGNNYQIKLEDVYTTKETISGLVGKIRRHAKLTIRKWSDSK